MNASLDTNIILHLYRAGCSDLLFKVIEMKRMKQCLSTLLVFCLLLTFVPISLAADWNSISYAVEGGNIYFNPTTGEITGADQSLTVVEIPDEIEGVSVTSIADSAFFSQYSLTSVTLPDTIMSIGDYAFYDCNALASLSLPSQLSSIGKQAFAHCYKLTEVILPDNLFSIPEYAFYNCNKLTEIEIPEAVDIIGAYAFNNCGSLTSLTISEGVESIGNFAFEGCRALTEVSIPSTTTFIGTNAFSQCAELTSITIPEGVIEIGVGAFCNCEKLKTIVLPASLSSIGEDAFTGCEKLTIFCPSDSFALQYAADNQIPYIYEPIVSLSGQVQDTHQNGVPNVIVTVYDIGTGKNLDKLVTDAQGYWRVSTALGGHTYRISYFSFNYKTDHLAQTCTPDEAPLTLPPVTLLQSPYRTSGAVSVNKLTQPELAAAMQQTIFDDLDTFYTEDPSITAPYALGTLREDIVQAGLARLNNMRLIGGLPAVAIHDAYMQYCQAGSLLNTIHDELNHYPWCPSDMDLELYGDGYFGTSHSNLAFHFGPYTEGGPLAESVDLCMEDSDSYNVSALGHRRWILSPAMGYTGFGCVKDSWKVYSSHFVADFSGPAQDYDFISWPSSGSFPSEIFAPTYAWSVSLNPTYYTTPEQSEVSVTLTEVHSGKIWTFSDDRYYLPSDADEYFNVSHVETGISNCIIFRPTGIDAYEGVYSVTIDGLKDRSGNPVAFSYYVNFLSPEMYTPEASSGWCGYGLEWVQKNNKTLCVQGVSELDCNIALASYQTGKMIDVAYISASALDDISLSIDCPKGAEVKLFWLDNTSSPLFPCWYKQF